MVGKLKDYMTPAERASALARGEKVDRLPCNPNIANGAARIYGCKISDFNTNAKALAEAQIAVYRRFGSDSVRIFTDLFTCAEAMGAKAILPEDNTADLLEPAITDLRQIDQLRPVDPYKDGRLPVQVEAMKYLVDAIGTEAACSVGVVGPFTNSFFLVQMEKALQLICKDPEAMHKLCRISLESCKAWATVVMDMGLTPTISEPMSSCTVVSPRVFREFSLPYLKELVDFIKSRGKGVTMHVCGQTNKIWTDLADLGIAGMSIDNVASIQQCKESIGGRVKVLGNVDPGSVMYAGSPMDVRLATLECIRDGYDSPKGFVLMSGCSLPVETPVENIDMMMNTVREAGYPIDIEWVEAEISRCKQALGK